LQACQTGQQKHNTLRPHPRRAEVIVLSTNMPLPQNARELIRVSALANTSHQDSGCYRIEATSTATQFSTPLRDNAIHGPLIGLLEQGFIGKISTSVSNPASRTKSTDSQ
jgi:hypothetical protein